MARQTRQKTQRLAVAVVGDGQTERVYFADVRDTDRPKNLSIFPDYPRKIGSFIGVLERAQGLTADYDRVYAFIDLDKVIQDNQQIAYRKAKTKAETMGVIILENNPCFEVWILLHFTFTGHHFNNCNSVVDELRRPTRMPNYEKSEKFLSKARLYQSLKVHIQNRAIVNAIRLETDRQNRDELYPRAQAYQFFEWYFQNH